MSDPDAQPRSKRPLAFRVAAVLIALLILAATAELIATAVLFARDGRYIPARTRLARGQNTFIASITQGSGDCRYVDTLFPHPYLAFVHHRNPPCGGADINNVGLFGPDYPSRKPADRFVVLVTGGSVAAQFMRPAVNGVSYLESILNRDYESPTGKPFFLLNGGDGAWKQPQQLILFLLYADVIDAVATLDGFNEHHMLDAHQRFEYPSTNFLTLNPTANQNFSDVVKSWLLGRMYLAVSANPIASRSEAAYLVLERIDRYLRLKSGGARATTVESIFALPADWSQAEVREWQLAQYEKYLLAMDAVAAQRRVLSAHFIQPVPAIEKRLTAEERAVVGPLDYGDRYQSMVTDVLKLRAQGMSVFSLLDVFVDRPETLYADPIHLVQSADHTSAGYRAMAERISRELAEAWHLERRPARHGDS